MGVGKFIYLLVKYYLLTGLLRYVNTPPAAYCWHMRRQGIDIISPGEDGASVTSIMKSGLLISQNSDLVSYILYFNRSTPEI